MTKLRKNQIKLYNRLIPFIKKKQDDRKYLVEGEGGSGKTTTMCYTIDKLMKKDFLKKYNLFFIAPTNAAKKVLRKTILKFMEKNPENHTKFQNSLGTNIGFNTIHSFFKSKQEFDENGNQFFQIQWEKSVMTEMMKDQLKAKSEDPTFIVRKKHLIIVDECSMLDQEKFQMFMNVLQKYENTKVIFLGDRNQLSYVRTEEIEDEDYLSPVFKVDNTFLLKGNERSNDPKITKIINRSKKCVIKGKYDFKMKKSDLGDNVNLIVDKELNNKKVKDFIKNENPKFITYSNKRRDRLNNHVREQIYTSNHNYIDRYLFLEKEQVIFESNYSIDGIPIYYNTDEFIIQDVKYNIIEPLSFFGIFTKTFMFQKITLDDGRTLKQLCKSQIKIFEYIMTILKRCVKDYFSFNPHNPNFIGKAQRCKLCDSSKCKFRKFFNDELVCGDCYMKIRNHIEKQYICRFCKKLNTHTNCAAAKNYSHQKIKKHICDDMYSNIQELHDTYNLPIKYSYCITVYKSQGSTYKNVIIDYENIYSCNRTNIDNLTRSMYVANSRTSDKLWFLNYFHC